MLTEELILYRDFEEDGLLKSLVNLFEGDGDTELCYLSAGKLVTLSMEMGFNIRI